jgi:hypothetical protein
MTRLAAMILTAALLAAITVAATPAGKDAPACARRLSAALLFF